MCQTALQRMAVLSLARLDLHSPCKKRVAKYRIFSTLTRARGRTMPSKDRPCRYGMQRRNSGVLLGSLAEAEGLHLPLQREMQICGGIGTVGLPGKLEMSTVTFLNPEFGARKFLCTHLEQIQVRATCRRRRCKRCR